MAAPKGHYSHATAGAGLVAVSGQLPIAEDGTPLNDKPFEAQAEQVLANLRCALEAGGSRVDRLLQVRVYIVDVGLWPTFDAIYARWAGSSRPARAVVPVRELHYGCSLEIEALGLAIIEADAIMPRA